ncbi:glycosyltransferase [Halomonas sp. ATBC28]|uniref:glycosyltransferase n=1 Tax=unclassified Halomonas TaxID=2609666 RepID=UPI000C33E626|nr:MULTISPECIES: glycosyltransferase [unclassified Halomonas]PKH57894.1 hypothetical protein CXF94_23930 [Halomonas sp. Choline-3u-9]TMU23201.1 glycosyltransferase [Halomonas sp. ATBC28]
MSVLQEANNAFQAEDYTKALRLYRAMLTENPDGCDSELTRVVQFNMAAAQRRIHSPAIASRRGSKASVALADNDRVQGNIDTAKGSHVSGWFVDKTSSGKVFDCYVYLDNELYLTIKNDRPRPDLKQAGFSEGLGGFSFQIHPALLTVSSTLSLRFENGVRFDDIAIGERLAASLPTNHCFPLGEHAPVSVIVPIFNALDDVKCCVERLLQYTRPNVEVLLINDASTDPGVRQFLDSVSLPAHYHVYHNADNLGYTRTVNRGIELAGERDVILLNSDARVTPRWVEGLQRAVATDPLIATATPMSAWAGAFSAPTISNDNPLSSETSEADYAVAFRRHSLGLYPSVPTGNGFCLYIRRAALSQFGVFDAEAFPRGYGEENDFCMRARAAGWFNVIDDRTYVFHERNQSFGEQKRALMDAGRAVVDKRYPDYSLAISVFTQSPSIAAARFIARKAWNSVENHDPVVPRVLFVISTLTGGTPQTNRDLMRAIGSEIEPWLLQCDAQTLRLYRVAAFGPDTLVHQHTLSEPVEPLTHVSHEYDRVIQHWLAAYDFAVMHIRHLAWHSLNLPRLAQAEGVRVIKSFHDFYTACPTVKLLDENNVYCAGQCTNTKGTCQPELWQATGQQPVFPALKHHWVYQWRQQFVEKVVPYCDEFVTTHASVKETLLPLLKLPADNFHIIPHGRDFPCFYQLAAPYQPGEAIRILVLGHINEAKGSQLIQQLANQDKGQSLHFHILGDTELAEQPGIILHGSYQRDELAALVADINPHVGAVISIWNETWSHTLTELWALGLPAIVSDFPTLQDRVSASGVGWVVDIHTLQHSNRLYDLVVSQQQEKLQLIPDVQRQMEETGTTRHMAGKYQQLYFEKHFNRL